MPETQLHQISDTGPRPAELDVIFVHGLDGDYQKTWQRAANEPETYWPQWVAEDCPTARVWSLSYELASTSWKGYAIPLYDRVKNVFALLQVKGIGAQPIVFVTHSFGGVLVKDLVRYSLDRPDAEGQAIGKNTRGIVFLATPHTGSGLANVASWFSPYRSTKAIKELEKANSGLRELDDWFRDHIDLNRTSIVPFYETQNTRGVRVVDEVSGNPALRGVVAIPVDADHISICKPATRESLVYLRTRATITAILNANGVGSPTSPTSALLAESEAWCAARWQALDVPQAVARSMAQDPTVGAFSPDLLPSGEDKLRVVLGEIGSGKSLGAARFYQEALRSVVRDSSAPIPLFLSTGDLSGNLSHDLALKSTGRGDPRARGVRAAIDLTANPSIVISDLLLQARVIAESWKDARVLIVSRPSAAWDRVEERRSVPPLSEPDIVSLLTRTLGRPIPLDQLEKLATPVRSAIQQPQFALLFGSYLRTHNARLPRSAGELITDLVERAFQLSRLSESNQQAALQRLAIQIANNGGNPVASREFAAREIVDSLLQSHLVVERHRLLSFSDPLFFHWFAAQAVLAEPKVLEDPCREPRRLESWRYPLVVAIAQANTQQAAAIMPPLIAADIVFAVDILRRGVTSWNVPDEVPALTVQTFGAQAREAVEAWIGGLGPLTPLVTPRREDKTLWPLGVRIDGTTVYTSWYPRPGLSADVVELPEQLPDGWFPTEMAKAVYPAAWIWDWAQKQVALFLTPIVESDLLAMPGTHVGHELAWEFTNLALKVTPLFADQIALGDMEAVNRPPAGTQSATTEDAHRMWLVNSIVQQLRNDGQAHLERPWPKDLLPHDQLFPPGIAENANQSIVQRLSAEPWAMYAPQGLLAHAHVVYQMALQDYAEIVATWFPRMAHRMTLNVLLPLRLTGIIGMPSGPETPNTVPGPIIGFTLTPLDKDRDNEVTLTIENRSEIDPTLALLREHASDIAQEIARTRPEHKQWLRPTAWSGELTIFHHRPVTAVVRDWLRRDLAAIGWHRVPKEFHTESSPIIKGDDGLFRLVPDEEDIRRNPLWQ